MASPRLILRKSRKARTNAPHENISFYVCSCHSFCLKTHLHIQNRLSACFKTDFTASHFLQIILSVASLLFEITFSKFSRSKIIINSGIVSKLTKKFNFTYKSKCTDFNNALNKLILLRINLRHEDELNISHD